MSISVKRLLIFMAAFLATAGAELNSQSLPVQVSSNPLFVYAGFMNAQAQIFKSISYFNSPLWFFFTFQSSYFTNPENRDTTGKDIPRILTHKPPFRFSSKETRDDLKRRYMSDGYRNYYDVDSSGKKMSARYTFDEIDVSYPYEIDLEDYLAIRKEKIQKEVWDSLTTRYDLASALTGGDIARIISQTTGLTIPVPPSVMMGIFGKPEININVSGEVLLRVGWRWDSQNLGTTSAFGQTQSSPVFSQDIRVNVTGSIGDKLKLSTDWNTKRQFEYDNKFKVGYQGEDDEIIKLVELGNVSLPIPSTLIGGGQSLFGVRADFQFGPLFIKTIASQRRGERKFITAQGGVSKQPFGIRAYEYSDKHYFLDLAYREVYNKYFESSTPVIPASGSKLRIKEIEVWESTGDVREGPQSAVAVAYTNLPALAMGAFYPPAMKIATAQAGKIQNSWFMRLDSNRFQVDYNLGTLFLPNLRNDRYYAVAYRVEGETTAREDDLYYGTFSSMAGIKDTLILKLIYTPNLLPVYDTLWKRQMKNIYSISAQNVNINDTKIGIWYINQNNDSSDVLPGAPDKLVTILNVDQVTNSTGAAPADGKFDMRAPFFNAQYGEITFPSVEPFDDGLIKYFTKAGITQLASKYTYRDVYDTTRDAARKNTARDRYIISGEVSGRASDRISLGAFNLANGSVKVSLDGVPLREYEDFVVDYFSGQVTIRNPRASLPGANLKIEYEAQDIFNISTKTLLGVRADYMLLKSRRVNLGLGMTYMFYNQSAVIDRVRLGEEPVSNEMLGFDAKLTWDTPWLTKLLDHLPFYDTKAPSSMNFQGEWAMIFPEPNKRRSEVLSDNNEPVVYIDDFEGAQRYISLGLSPSQWTHASQPQDSTISLLDVDKSLFRGKTYWYQYFLPRVPINDVYPKKQIIQGRTNLNPLIITFDPRERGIYNQNPRILDKTHNPLYYNNDDSIYVEDNLNRMWGGFQRVFSSFNTNFDNENIEYIEIMMKIESIEKGRSRMFLELGQISEDIIPNKQLNTEDGITPANPIPNGMLDPDEDVGLDTLSDGGEKILYPIPLNEEEDPARDNFAFNFGADDYQRGDKDYVGYNNPEKNGVFEQGQFPDTEILDKINGQFINQHNDYFTYEINLDDNSKTNPQIVGGNEAKGWYLYRIPIRKPNSTTGSPSFANIKYVRIWFKGGFLKVNIADWKLVGSYWQRNNNLQSDVSDNDSTLSVAFINLEENSGPPDYYQMPPGVSAPRQLNNPDPNMDIRMNEQSLSISVKNLRYNDERMAVRYFRSLDVFNYKQLKFFVHGGPEMPDQVVEGAIPKAFAYIRFGIDSMNYYEYRRPLLRNWQDIAIVLSELTAIKQLRDTSGTFLYQRQEFPIGSKDPLALYAIRGNPVLTRVQYFAFGISNPALNYADPLTSTMWVDELRLISPERSNDWGAVVNGDVKFADLGSVNASFSSTLPNFHRLEERFGNRSTTSSWTVSALGNIEKFLPKPFKETKLPLSYTHSEYVENPEFVANNDIRLDNAANVAYQDAINNNLSPEQARQVANAVRARSQTLRIQDSWALTGIRLGIPINHWLIKETFNKLTLGYSYNQEMERSPVVEQRFFWQWQLTAGYSLTIPEVLAFKPTKWLKEVPLLSSYTDWKLNLLPSNFQTGLNLSRRRQTEQSRYLEYPSPVIRNFTSMRQLQFSWKISENGFMNPLFDYNVQTGSTLVPYEIDEYGRQRTGSELASHILFSRGKLFDFGANNLHSQTVTINFKPRLPLGSYTKFIESNGSFTTAYSWNNPLQPDESIRDIAKSANFNNSIRYNLGFRLKGLVEELFGLQNPTMMLQKPKFDTSKKALATNALKDVMRAVKSVLFDFEKIDINFNQTNTSLNPGVYGGTGFDNFWSRGMTGRSSDNSMGPAFAYQLGLIGDPHGSFETIGSDKFPYFGFRTSPGKRPPNGVMQDNFSQRNNLDIRTARPLWEGASLDLTWRTEVGFNKNRTVVTDSLGVPFFSNIMAMESFSRTFITIPSVFGLNLFNNTIEHVIELYETERDKILATDMDTVLKNQAMMNALAESFRTGMEAFSLSSGSIGRFLPAINWAFRWEGIEKWGIFESIGAKRISLEHVYNGRYQENSQITDLGRNIQGQQVQHGFQPLIGLTLAFDEKKMKGNLTGTVRYVTQNSYSLTSANRATITKTASDELQLNFNYTLRQFKFTLFNLDIQNDLELIFLTSWKKNESVTYDVTNYQGEQGRTLSGNSQLIIEPRIRYQMSQRVSASFFFRYEGTFTEGASNPGYSTTQVGLDIRLSIAGGR